MPTAPEILPTAIVSRARAQRAPRLRVQLRVPERQLQPEGHRLGVDAVRAADHRRAAMLLGAARGSTRAARSRSARMRSHASRHLQRQRRVDDVGRGEAEVQPARARPDVLGDVGGEGDHVVLRHLLDVVDARDLEGAALADVARGLGAARCRPRAITSAAAVSTCSQVSKRRALAPDAPHVGVGVPWNHARSSRRAVQVRDRRVDGPSTVAPSDPFENRSAATRCTSSAGDRARCLRASRRA